MLTSGPEPWEVEPPSEATLTWIAKGSSSYPGDLTVTLRQFLARLPDLMGLFEATLDETAPCFRANMMVVCETADDKTPGQISTFVDLIRHGAKLPPVAEITGALGIPEDRVAVRTEGVRGDLGLILHHDSLRDLWEFLPPVRTNTGGSNYLVAPFPNTVVMSTMSLMFGISYILGMLARYFPTVWHQMTSLAKGDAIFPLVQSTVKAIERRYPVEVAERMSRKWPQSAMIEQPNVSGHPSSAGIYTTAATSFTRGWW
jgi:hypothetical protein